MNQSFAKGVSTATVAITDFEMISAKVAKVMLAYTGQMDADTLKDLVSAKLKHMAAPIEKSFRSLGNNRAVGFVRANRAIRAGLDDTEISANYTVVAKSNILMDNKDSTLWRVKDGAAGKYLAREGNEDLSELIKASVHHRSDVAKLSQVQMATASTHELVAFANVSGDIDYGFCVGTKAGALRVVSSLAHAAVDIPESAVVSAHALDLRGTEISKKLATAGMSRENMQVSIDYYKSLFSYAPEYLAQVIKQIEGTYAVA